MTGSTSMSTTRRRSSASSVNCTSSYDLSCFEDSKLKWKHLSRRSQKRFFSPACPLCRRTSTSITWYILSILVMPMSKCVAFFQSNCRQVLLRDIDTINGAGTSNNQGNRTAILNIVMQLRKCCNHPYLFPAMEDRTLDPLGEHLYQNCGKMVLITDLNHN